MGVVGPHHVGQFGGTVEHAHEGAAVVRLVVDPRRESCSPDVQGEIDAADEGPGVDHQTGLRLLIAGPLPPALEDLRLVPMAHHRVGEEIVRPRWMMERGLETDPGAAGTGDRPDGRRDARPSMLFATDRPERELCRGRETSRRRQRHLAAEGLAQHVGERIGELRQEVGPGMRTVVLLRQGPVRGPEVGGDVDDELRPEVQKIPGDLP